VTDTRVVERSWSRVRQLAERHPDQWEGQDLVGEAPLRVFVGQRAARRVLVVTKEAALRRWNRSDWPVGLLVVVASGMITRAQAAVLAELAIDRSLPIAFVGDADPMSLHTYLSLRAHLGARRVRFGGICDEVLDIIGDEKAQPDSLGTLELSVFDQAHLRVVATMVKPQQVLGPRVAAVLRSGKKIEIEALSFRADLTPALFNAALRLASAGRRRRRGS
jgi:DNA topoisomerase VI subunit A